MLVAWNGARRKTTKYVEGTITLQLAVRFNN